MELRSLLKSIWQSNVIRVILPVGLTVILFIFTVFLITLPTLEHYMLDSKREMIRELANVSWALLVEYEQRVQSGELSTEEAQNRAKTRIRTMRYGSEGKDYFWITDMHPNMVMHPYFPELEGQDISEFADPNGKKLFMESVKIVKKNNAGYVSYLWQWKDDPERISLKLSYVKGFKPWGWIIGTGVYVKDIHATISLLTRRLNRAFAGVLVIIVVLSAYIVRQGIIVEKKRMLAEKALRESEQRLTDIINFLPDATFVIDHQKKIIAWNLAMEELTGIASTDILGKGNYEYALPFYGKRRPILSDLIFESQQEIQQTYTFFKNEENRISGEAFAPKIGLGGRHLYGAASPLYDLEGNIIGAIQSIRDITELRQTEEELRWLRNLLSNIIDSMPSVLIAVDSDGHVMQWNREAENLTGITPLKAQGRILADVFPQLSGEMKRVRLAIQEQKPQKHERVPHLNNHQVHYSDITIYPLIAEDIEGVVIRVDDVTERVKIEEVMIQTEKMMTVGGLAGGMAHEINNPLGIILQGIQNTLRRLSPTLEKNQQTAEELGLDLRLIRSYLEQRNIFQYLQGIQDAAMRASKIVSNMLNFSRHSETTPETIDINQLLEKTIELAANDYDLKKKYDFRHINIIRNYDSALIAVPCIPTKIEQVFLNLLRNAAQAISEKEKEKGYEPQITIQTYNTDEYAHIEIEDNGSGMDKETRKRIFEPFYTTKAVGIGTGLGLSVSYFIITNNHSGTLTVESSPGIGTKFIIRLPLTGRRQDSMNHPLELIH